MSKRIMGLISGLVIAIVGLAVLRPGAIQAQGVLDPGGEPGYGSSSLSTGFVPDPLTIRLTTGGRVDAAQTLGASCTGIAAGYVATAPDYRVQYTARQPGRVRFFVTAEVDTTLVIYAPDGRWYCADDVLNTLDPMITFEAAISGPYNVWVGSTQRGAYRLADLYVTANLFDPLNVPAPGVSAPVTVATPAPVVTTGVVDVGRDPTYGTAILSDAFAPDPHAVPLVAGGGVGLTANLGAICTGEAAGYANAAPDYRVYYTPGTAPRLMFFFAGAGDTTLAINAPDGNWYCDDDGAGDLNPLVIFAPPQSGWYNVWVGSFNASDFVTGQLYASTQTVAPADLLAGDGQGGGGAADQLAVSANPVQGSQSLDNGLVPDPLAVPVAAGGGVDLAGQLAGVCGAGAAGYATAAPTYRVKYTTRRALEVRVFVVAPGGDATLAVNLPDGSWACNDDSTDGQDPLLILPAQDGWYTIWIGSYNPGTIVNGTLYLSELPFTPGNFR